MSDLGNQRRMAAAILKCGVNRVWFDPERQADIEAAISRNDLRELIGEGAIRANPVKG
ncbi:MAG TPA: 50S ribosomal protein L19e, partial [Methanoculleus sp.]|nr:50S ribosomal protein L19e [Methanoculleus sp.]